jgi:hypothetical protein
MAKPHKAVTDSAFTIHLTEGKRELAKTHERQAELPVSQNII